MNDNIQYIGKVSLDYTLYGGEDLYKDGSEEELLSIVQNTDESGYNDIITARRSWPILYHLSDIRGNIVDFLPFTKEDEVLEIGAGCGAITGTLARHAGHVDCIELSKARSLVNATRHQRMDNINILVGNFQDIEKTLTKQYDYITLIGVLEYAASYIASDKPYEEFLTIIKKHLKPKGRLIIAIENKYGLKYWAGCKEDHIANFMSGLEGYVGVDSVKTFSKNGLTKLLDSIGLSCVDYYYPYPDYKLPLSIYSDEYLPSKGSLNNNFRNFDNDRMLLFDETRVFDNLIDDGMFEMFSNSFLVSAGSTESDKNDRIIFSKFSNDRNPAYKIRTDIYKKDGRREVYKVGTSDAGDEHIRKMDKLYEGLQTQAENTIFDINKSRLTSSGLELEYISGETLESKLDEALHSKDNWLFSRMVMEYQDEVWNMAKEDFVPTDKYYEVFGENAYTGPAKSMKISNIDMIFPNILVNGDKWTVIDYEWSFDFPIPVNFVLYRTIHYYIYTGRDKLLNDMDIESLFSMMGVDRSFEEVYLSMERSFQNFIIRNNTPLWKLYEIMGRLVLDMPGAADRMVKNLPSVIMIKKDETTETRQLITEQSQDGVTKAVLGVNDEIKTLLYCPAQQSCVVKMISVKAYTSSGEEYEPAYIYSGISYEDNVIFFKEDNPHIITDDIREGTEKIVFNYKLVTCGKGMKDDFDKLFGLFPERNSLKAEKENIIEEDYREVVELQERLEQAENELNAMRNSTSWKVTEPARKLRGIGKE